MTTTKAVSLVALSILLFEVMGILLIAHDTSRPAPVHIEYFGEDCSCVPVELFNEAQAYAIELEEQGYSSDWAYEKAWVECGITEPGALYQSIIED